MRLEFVVELALEHQSIREAQRSVCGVSTAASMSLRKLSQGTKRSMASSGSPFAESVASRLSASKNPSCPIVRFRELCRQAAELHEYEKSAIFQGAHIDANLETGSLSADDLCLRFHISRASLYRLFGPEGGLARYVQDQRLNRALRLLISPDSRGKRLIELAVDLQFSGDSTFVRAFRRQFGLTPGEIRDLSVAWLRETGGVPGPDDLLHHLVEP